MSAVPTIPGIAIRATNQRAVAMISEVEPGCLMVKAMRFLYPSEAKQEAKGRQRDQLAWCPEEYRAQYRKMRRMGLRASEARPMIEEQIGRDLVRRPLDCGERR